MKKNFLNKILYILLLTVGFLFILEIKSNAASLSVSTSKSSVSPGGTFTVTVTVNGGAGKVVTTVSNGSGSKTGFLDNSSYSFTCTAGSSGSVTIRASGSIADYTTEEESNKSASKTVKIVKANSNSGSSSNNTTTIKPKKSSDTTLSELTVEEGTISPEFDNDVKEYTLTVPNEITKINVKATPTDNKATVKVEGNEDLKEGENPVTITVTAEDGTTDKYTINVTRERAKLSLQSLIIKYENENGEQIEIPLNPAFSNEIQEYTLDNIEYWVEKLNIEAIANIEGATIEVQGADNLQTGENIITITVKLPAQEQEETTEENEEELSAEEETIIYTIKVNKNEEPTILAKISNWFKGIFGGVSSWYNNNQEQTIVGALSICIVALFGLSIYIIVDYNRYKDVIAKVKKVKKVKKVNEININKNITEEIYQKNNAETLEKQEKKADNENNVKSGKHF